MKNALAHYNTDVVAVNSKGKCWIGSTTAVLDGNLTKIIFKNSPTNFRLKY
jgi:hypothetical protein